MKRLSFCRLLKKVNHRHHFSITKIISIECIWVVKGTAVQVFFLIELITGKTTAINRAMAGIPQGRQQWGFMHL